MEENRAKEEVRKLAEARTKRETEESMTIKIIEMAIEQYRVKELKAAEAKPESKKSSAPKKNDLGSASTLGKRGGEKAAPGERKNNGEGKAVAKTPESATPKVLISIIKPEVTADPSK